MWSVIGDNLAVAIGISISIAPIIGLIAILTGPRARTSGAAFALGWLLGVTGVLLLSAAIGGAAEASSAGGLGDQGLDLFALAAACLFLSLAYRSVRNRPIPGELAAEPKWLKAIDSLTPLVAFGLAAGIVVVNLKNLPLLLSTGGDFARAGLGVPEAIGAAVCLGVVASLGALVPVGVYLLGGSTAAGVLASWRRWLVQNSASVMAVLFLILGVSKLGAAVSGLL